MGNVRQDDVDICLHKCGMCGTVFEDKGRFDEHLPACLAVHGWYYVVMTMRIQVLLFGEDPNNGVQVDLKRHGCPKEKYDRDVWKIERWTSLLGTSNISVNLPDDSPENIMKGLGMLKTEALDVSEDRFSKVQREIGKLTVDRVLPEDASGVDKAPPSDEETQASEELAEMTSDGSYDPAHAEDPQEAPAGRAFVGLTRPVDLPREVVGSYRRG